MSVVLPARVDRRTAEMLDALIRRRNYSSRSDAIRQILRKTVSEEFSAVTNEKLQAVARASAAVIREAVGQRVSSVVLYGSVARGEANEESDIDLLVLVDDDQDLEEITNSIVKRIEPISLATETVVTPLVLSRSELEEMIKARLSFALSVEKEGVVLEGEEFGSRKRTSSRKSE